ncbi:MAG: G5 domain-containing protein [Clostridia bacterium]|nr:G5 domain-containing protein [Clostridia bacterium]
MLKFSRDTFKYLFDFVKPRALFCLALSAALVLSAFMFFGQVNTFEINYGSNTKVVRSLSASVNNAIRCAGINTDDYKIESTDSIGGKTVISLLKTFPVYITSGDKTHKITAIENDTVQKVLSYAGFVVDEYDMIEPALDCVVSKDTYIDYVNVDYVSGSYTQAVPHSIDTVYSDNLEEGKQITSPGKDGLEQIIYTQKIVNGEVVDTSVDNRITLLAVQNSIKTLGTRRVAVKTSAEVSSVSQLTPDIPIELDEAGNPVNYTKHVTVQATAYTYTGHNCATGVSPKPGYIAVNPRVIPYGTRMYIKTSDGKYVYGYAVAADTGGFIKKRPTNVDLFFPTAASTKNFGRRNVEIYILG